MAQSKRPGVAIVGAGKVGTSIALAFAAERYPIVSVISRTGGSALTLARKVKCKRASTNTTDIDPACQIIVIATPDDAIARVAKELAGVRSLRFSKLFVIHTSGSLSSEALEPLRKKGAHVASMHPVQTFPSASKRVRIAGIHFGIEGRPEAIQRARVIAATLDAATFEIARDLKPVYHAACVLSSGGFVTLLNAIESLARKAGFGQEWTGIFGPLMTASVQNALQESPAAALTGPAARGDVATIGTHLDAMKKAAPALMPLYLMVSADMSRIAAESGTISVEQYQKIINMFRKFIVSMPTTTVKQTS
jgi:predicted short-subunit dehydrogenase-like oxidoreductase (DUF2520 family)